MQMLRCSKYATETQPVIPIEQVESDDATLASLLESIKSHLIFSGIGTI